MGAAPQSGEDRALVLSGGGIRAAWQAGVVQALDEAGLTFRHADGTSGGSFVLGMLLSGVPPAELGARWRSLDVRRFVAPLPWRDYVRPVFSWPAVGSADGIERHVLPALGIDIARIRAATHMTGSFNVADFAAKRCVAIPHDEIDQPRFLAGVSLPIVMPAVEAHGRTWIDAVWIQQANLWEAVRRGCTEIWVAWCIGNTPRYGAGPLEQYVNMIEMSANSALFGELERIAELNERRSSTGPVTVHVVHPLVPLPGDADLLAGRVDTETLVAMGYRDAVAYLASPLAGSGVDLHGDVTATPTPDLGARVTIRLAGPLSPVAGVPGPTGRSRLFAVVQATDLAAFVGDPAEGAPVVGSFTHPTWGYRPFASGRLRVVDEAGSGAAWPSGETGARRFELTAEVHVDGSVHEVTATALLPDHGRGRWAQGAQVTWDVRPARAPDPTATGHATLGRGDAARLILSFEPSGASDLTSRPRAMACATRLVRRRLSRGDVT